MASTSVDPTIEYRQLAPPRVAEAHGDPRDRFFCTAHLNEDLRGRTVRAGAVTLTAQAAKFILRLGSTAVLARLLTPADFGLIAMVTVVTGFVEMFKDAGLSTATIQRDKITHDQVSTLFWINVLLSVAIMLVIASMAPLLAWFYGDQRLTQVTLALSATMVFGGLTVQHQALLRRKMQFTHLAAIDIASMSVGIATAIVMAWNGFSYWALVGMTAASGLTTALMSFAMSGWMPGMPVKGCGVLPMLKFGGNLSLASMFNYLIRNGDNFIIGTLHGGTALGIYSRAYSLLLLPLQQFLSPITAVAVPALSRARSEPLRFRQLLLEKSEFIVLAVVVTTGFIFAAAPELIALVLGPGWSEAATILRCLSLGGAVYGTNIAGTWVCTTHGTTHRQLYVAIVCAPIYLLAYLIGAQFGPAGVAAGFSLTCCLLRWPVFRYFLQGTPITPWDLLRPLLRTAAIVAIAALLAMEAAQLIEGGGVERLLVKTLAYLALLVAAVACRLLPVPTLLRSSWRST